MGMNRHLADCLADAVAERYRRIEAVREQSRVIYALEAQLRRARPDIDLHDPGLLAFAAGGRRT